MKIDNMMNSGNVSIKAQAGPFRVLEHSTDLSQYSAEQAIAQYYMQQQGIHKRQLAISLNNSGVILQHGAMQWIAGHVKQVTDVKGVGDLFSKAIKGKVSGESTINPLYTGSGLIITEPTYKHILLEDIGQHGGLVVTNGLFLACESTIRLDISMVKSVSGALAGNEGLFNMVLRGTGVAALASPLPIEEVVRVDMEQGDEVHVDGPYALMWDDELVMTVERSGKSLLGSAVGGEGLVNVFRGAGSLWLTTSAAPVRHTI
jgi:uncharacterized protein (AIM24 family)